MHKRYRRKKYRQGRVLLLCCGAIILGASLLYWLITVISNPVYYNYSVNLPIPLSSLTKHPYNFTFLDRSSTYYRYDDGVYESILGIDVSSHNKEIDWQKVYDSGIRFVYLRVGFRGYGSEGILRKDEKFEEYYKGAKKAGLAIGVYFFSQAISHQEAMEEAFFTLEAIRHKDITLPVAYDLEDIDYDHSRIDGVSGLVRSENALVFSQKIQENGLSCVIYGNKHWMQEVYDASYIQHQPLWFAQYHDYPDVTFDFMMWQYTDKGRVNGIEGDTDMNLLFVLKDKLPDFAK